MIQVTSGFTSNRIEAVTVAIEAGTKAATAKVRHLVAEAARERAKVLTGAMREGIHETDEGVVASSPHSGFVDRGTSKAPAQPFMTPAAEIGRVALVPEVTAAVKEASA